MSRVHIKEFSKEHGQAKAAEMLGLTQGALNKALRVGRDIYVTELQDGSLFAEEVRPFPSQTQFKKSAQPTTRCELSDAVARSNPRSSSRPSRPRNGPATRSNAGQSLSWDDKGRVEAKATTKQQRAATSPCSSEESVMDASLIISVMAFWPYQHKGKT